MKIDFFKGDLMKMPLRIMAIAILAGSVTACVVPVDNGYTYPAAPAYYNNYYAPYAYTPYVYSYPAYYGYYGGVRSTRIYVHGGRGWGGYHGGYYHGGGYRHR
jgi:hypothetical protein